MSPCAASYENRFPLAVIWVWTTLAAVSGFAQTTAPYMISTISGGGKAPFPSSGVTATSVRLVEPRFAALDARGNIYLSETYYHRVLRIAPDGAVTSIAGGDRPGFSGNGGPASQALINTPSGLAIGPGGDLFVCDTFNGRVRRILPNGTISTVAGNGTSAVSGDGGAATSAGIGSPVGIAFDSAGNYFFSDGTNHVVRRVDTAGTITTVAGVGRGGFGGDGGPATEALLRNPQGLAVDTNGALYIADQFNHRVRRVSQGRIATFAGTGESGFANDNGPATSATITFPADVKVDASGIVYISDRSNGLIRRVGVNGNISTLRITNVATSLPNGIVLDGSNRLLIVDDVRTQVVRVDLSTQIGTVVAGGSSVTGIGDNGPAAQALFLDPWGVAVDADGNVFVADTGDHRIRRVNTSGIITTFAGNGRPEHAGDNGPTNLAALGAPFGLSFDRGNLFVTAALNGVRVRRTDSAGTISTVAGGAGFGFSGDGGQATAARLFTPLDVFAEAGGNLYIADTANQRVRRVAPSGIITTIAGTGTSGFAGDGGPGTQAQLDNPSGVTVDSQGNVLIADTGNHRIRRVDRNGTINTFAGTGVSGAGGDGGPATAAQISSPRGIRFDAAGNLLLTHGGRVRMVTPNGTISTIAGLTGPAAEGLALGTALPNPVSIIPGPGGSLYVVDNFDQSLRKLTPSQFTAAGLVNAASFRVSSATAGGLFTLFGTDLASGLEVASSATFPQQLGGTSAEITSGGVTRACGMYLASPGQISFVVPTEAVRGDGVLSVLRDGRKIGVARIRVDAVSPGLFSAASNGQGVAAAVALKVAADGTQTQLPVFSGGSGGGAPEAVPIDLGEPGDQVFLLLFGTGIRGFRDVIVTIGGTNVAVLGAAAQGQFAGLDQINVGPLPRSLGGRGEVNVVATVDGIAGNAVTIRVR